MNAIYSFYYTRFVKMKLHIRNALIMYERNDFDEMLLLTSSDLATLFLINADNIDKELYNEEEMKIVQPILDLYLNDEVKAMELNREDAKQYLHLAMNKRLNIHLNEALAVKMAEEYNANCSNPLLIVSIDTFRELCQSIDDKPNE